MDDVGFARRVRCAAGAAWWVVLIWAAWMTAGWFIWLGVQASQTLTAYAEAVWGGVRLAEVRMTVWVFYGAMKMLLFACFLAAIFLSIWHRKLRRAT